MVEAVSRRGLPAGTLLNVNIPNVPLADLKGFAVTRMGRSRFAEIFNRRTTPRGDIYYWMDGELQLIGDIAGTDIEAVNQGYVSLTPIGFDLTQHSALAGLKAWDLHL